MNSLILRSFSAGVGSSARCSLVLLSILFIGCGKTSEMESKVRTGYWGRDRAMTIGDAFLHYPYFTESKWKTVMKDSSEGGAPMVKFTALVDYSRVSDKQLADSIIASKAMRNSMGGLRIPGDPLEPGQPEPMATDEEISRIRKAMKGVEVVINFDVREVPFELYNVRYSAIQSDGKIGLQMSMSNFHEKALVSAIMQKELPPMTTTVLLKATVADGR